MVGPTPQHWANREELEMQYTTRIKATSISSLARSIGRNLSLFLLTCPSMIGPRRSRFHMSIPARVRFIRTMPNPPAVTRLGQMRPDLGCWDPSRPHDWPRLAEVRIRSSTATGHPASKDKAAPGTSLERLCHQCGIEAQDRRGAQGHPCSIEQSSPSAVGSLPQKP